MPPEIKKEEQENKNEASSKLSDGDKKNNNELPKGQNPLEQNPAEQNSEGPNAVKKKPRIGGIEQPEEIIESSTTDAINPEQEEQRGEVIGTVEHGGKKFTLERMPNPNDKEGQENKNEENKGFFSKLSGLLSGGDKAKDNELLEEPNAVKKKPRIGGIEQPEEEEQRGEIIGSTVIDGVTVVAERMPSEKSPGHEGPEEQQPEQNNVSDINIINGDDPELPSAEAAMQAAQEDVKDAGIEGFPPETAIDNLEAGQATSAPNVAADPAMKQNDKGQGL